MTVPQIQCRPLAEIFHNTDVVVPPASNLIADEASVDIADESGVTISDNQ
jgi:hypothetical protein